MISSEKIHTESENMCTSVFRFDWASIFDGDCGKRVIMVLKYPNCLNELYVTSSATAPTAICVNKWTGLTIFLKPQHAPVSSISRLQFTWAPAGKGSLHSLKLSATDQLEIYFFILYDKGEGLFKGT